MYKIFTVITFSPHPEIVLLLTIGAQCLAGCHKSPLAQHFSCTDSVTVLGISLILTFLVFWYGHSTVGMGEMIHYAMIVF